MGMAAAPFVSLVVVPLGVLAPAEGDRAQAERRGGARASRAAAASPSPCWRSCSPSRRCSTRGVLAADLTATDAAVAGYVFTALLIARAPLQLFQAVQGSLLPHLAGLEATAGPGGVRARDPDHDPGHRGLRAAPSRSGCCSLGPFAMDLLFDDDTTFGRLGLAAVALGMGAHLAAGTLNQAALARDHAGAAAAAWLRQRRRVRGLDAARRRRRRARPRRGRATSARRAAVRAAGGRLPSACVTRGGRLSGRRGERSFTRPEP